MTPARQQSGAAVARTPARADIAVLLGFGVLISRDATMNRRDFVRTAAGAGLAAATPIPPASAATPMVAPAVRRSAVRPLVIADASGIEFKNGGPECAVERAFRLITQGKDVLDALIAGVNIPELDPEETGI